MIPINWGSVVGLYNIKPFIGITSTPVIDPASNRIWVSVKTLVSDDDLRYTLYALDIRDGKILATSQPIQSGDGVDKLDGKIVLQRPGLLHANGMIYLAFGSHQDGGFYHGWVVALDQETLEQKYVFNATPGNVLGEGGIWQAGNGLASDCGDKASVGPGNNSSDCQGNIYLMTGNGVFSEADHQYGTSFVKLSPDLKVVDWFTPSNYLKLTVLDIDLGSSGPMLIPGSKQLVGGGKQGYFYVLNRDDMGHLQHGNALTPGEQIFKVSDHWTLDWISWLIPVFGYHHIHGGPIFWNGAQRGPLVYVWPEASTLKAYKYDPMTHFQKKAALVGPKAPKGMPGGILSISANGNQNGIVWAVLPLKDDAFVRVVRGTMRAFDANTLESLWSADKSDPEDVFNFAKYCPPTVANGKVYLATFSDKLNVYGLTPPPPSLPSWTNTGKPIKKSHGHGQHRM
jgi:outer membrane protein assembly factor BamB